MLSLDVSRASLKDVVELCEISEGSLNVDLGVVEIPIEVSLV